MWFVVMMRATSRMEESGGQLITPGRMASATRACWNDGDEVAPACGHSGVSCDSGSQLGRDDAPPLAGAFELAGRERSLGVLDQEAFGLDDHIEAAFAQALRDAASGRAGEGRASVGARVEGGGGAPLAGLLREPAPNARPSRGAGIERCALLLAGLSRHLAT